MTTATTSIKRRDLGVKNMSFITDATANAKTVRGHRSGKGSTAGHRSTISTKQTKLITQLYSTLKS